MYNFCQSSFGSQRVRPRDSAALHVMCVALRGMRDTLMCWNFCVVTMILGTGVCVVLSLVNSDDIY